MYQNNLSLFCLPMTRNLTYSSNTVGDASVVVNKELDSIYEWLCVNKSINTYKTKYIVFKIRNIYICPVIYIRTRICLFS